MIALLLVPALLLLVIVFVGPLFRYAWLSCPSQLRHLLAWTKAGIHKYVVADCIASKTVFGLS